MILGSVCRFWGSYLGILWSVCHYLGFVFRDVRVCVSFLRFVPRNDKSLCVVC